MAVLVPFHQDQRLPDDALPLRAPAILPSLPESGFWNRVTALHDGVAAETELRIREGERPALVSGDCLVALAVLRGARRAGHDPGVVWFDAHGDVHTMESSTSGYVSGMALRFALGAGPLALDPPLAEERATLVDARDLDPAEAEYLSTAAIRRVSVAEVGPPDEPVVLHVDLDVIDGAELPGLWFPTPGGPSRAEVVAAVRRVFDSGNVVALHVACPWEPGRDQENRARLLAELTQPTG